MNRKYFTPVLSGITGLIIGLFFGLTVNTYKPVDQFKKGQVLFPDMAHSDTLIVYDPEYLNKCLSDGRLKTDQDIMEILNETTIRYNTPCEPSEYQFNISDEGTEVFQGKRFVGFLPLDTTQSLDKLMIEDNQ